MVENEAVIAMDAEGGIEDAGHQVVAVAAEMSSGIATMDLRLADGS